MPPLHELFDAAHFAACALFALVLVWWSPRPRAKLALFATALALVAMTPQIGDWGRRVPPLGMSTTMLAAAALCATVAVSLPKPTWLTFVAAQAQVLLFALCIWIPWDDLTPSAAHLVALGALVALDRRATDARGAEVTDAPPLRGFVVHDAAIFALALGAAAFVATFVLERFILSGDEWAYTFQADVFAHGHLYATPRDCPAVFKNWWVFLKDGRLFEQYTPGWAFVMTPFQRFDAAWLAAPFVLGTGAAAVARLARRAARAGIAGASAMTRGDLAWAGFAAAAAFVLCPSMLLNGASRYSHPLVCASWAWGVVAVCALVEETSPRAQVGWGAALGVACALLLATRPLDGCALGVPIAALFAMGLVRRRIGARGLVATLAPFLAVGGFALVVLRVQLGEWFVSGYSLAPPEVRNELGWARPDQLGAVLKLDRGAAWFWPCAPAIAALGLFVTRRSSRKVGAILIAGSVLLVTLYSFTSFGREPGDSGYGPRYLLPEVVAMAVGAGVLAAAAVAHARRLRRSARARAFGALAIAALVAVGGTVHFGRPIYPLMHTWVHDKLALKRAIARDNLHHAVVVVHEWTMAMQAWDEAQNLPSDPDPDVMIITDYKAGDDFACAQKRYGDRDWYVGSGIEEVVLKRFP